MGGRDKAKTLWGRLGRPEIYGRQGWVGLGSAE